LAEVATVARGIKPPSMATKAERFKAEAMRSGQKKPARPPKHKRDIHRMPNPTAHNESSRAKKRSGYALEFAQTVRPSRKSSRKSNNRQKTDSVLRTTAMNRNASPEVRAARRGRNRM
jgi:hypothetical protein